jgi:hypothetical protein
LIERKAIRTSVTHTVNMQNVLERLADTRARVAQTEYRVAEQHERVRTSAGDDCADAALQLYSAASTLGALWAYQVVLEDLARKWRSQDGPPSRSELFVSAHGAQAQQINVWGGTIRKLGEVMPRLSGGVYLGEELDPTSSAVRAVAVADGVKLRRI